MVNKTQLPEGIPPLSTYYLYITGSCNLACRHCWISPKFLGMTEVDDGTASLPFDLYEAAILEGEPLGLNHIKFTGGEPFVHPQVERMLSYAYERHLGASIETNGTLINETRARFLQEKTSVTFISVSLDGASSATHDYLRGVPGSFARAQEGVKHLVNAGFHPQIIMSLYEDNVCEIETLALWATSIGCSSLKLNIIQDIGRGGKLINRLHGVERLIDLGYDIERTLQSRVSIPIYYTWPPAFKKLSQLESTGGCDSCNIHNILGVLNNGYVSMCGIGDQENALIYGLIGRNSIADIWINNPILKELRSKIPYRLEGVCNACLLRDTCMGFCPAANYWQTKNLCAPFWLCRDADDLQLFPEMRKRVNNLHGSERKTNHAKN